MTVFQPRDRVHLKGHPHTPHTTGTVRSVDALGVHVLWDDSEVVTTQLPLYLEPAGEPMKNEFTSAESSSDRTLVIDSSGDSGVLKIMRGDYYIGGINLDPANAPAIALAVLESAGHVADIDDASSLVNSAMGRLAMHVTTEAAKAKEAADREALEAEAMELYRALHPHTNFTSTGNLFPAEARDYRSLARAARQLHGITS